MDFQEIMKKAQQLQSQMGTDLANMAIESTAGGGAIRVVMNGVKEVTKLDISPELTQDPEMLADMIQAALNRAYSDVDQKIKERMSTMLGGFDPSTISNLFK
ncbi:MAG: YbaB/EbfC family nucleoid-associated protein [Acidobacteria bacterium]|nr:YbaB/EbfC family nucleoid-associated protein [Acidobacteriota bacterium]